jgi:hypothetical protein
MLFSKECTLLKIAMIVTLQVVNGCRAVVNITLSLYFS